MPDFPSKTLSTDALAIQSVVRRLVEDEARNVLVLMHSYGGLVGSEAILEEFSREKRKEQGLAGGVFHLFFFAAFVLAEGQSVLGVFGESPNNDIRPGSRFRIKNPTQTLYNDLPPEEAEYWASKIIDQSYAVQTTKLTRASYRYIPSTYVVCENDQGPPPQYQEMFGKRAGADVLRIASGHSPMLSKTEELANMVAAAAQETMKDIN
ncbi:hypothetical protein DL764_008386 [Monosporascus ibericus]|uniref:AB hydrolase-1 domain-containing protein n=1 Tax=Monosporascus ibericus TaxID=155417 RepID=A0A4Q4SXN8_9PEZI|nr:hypothetical protein DL764_008386 [Monosporascus ibericus]